MAPNSRCSFDSLLSNLKLLRKSIRKPHLDAISKTPFNVFFKSCFDLKKNDNLELKKDNKALEKILDMYDKDKKGFNIGLKCLHITVDELCVTFGLPKGLKEGNEVKTKSDKSVNSGLEFTTRHFEKGHVYARTMVDAMNGIANSDDPEDVNDYSCLMFALICCTMFLSDSGGALSKKILKSIYVNMHTTNWAEMIYNNLMSSIESYNGKFLNGCSIFLLHVKIVDMVKGKEAEVPRFLRWNIGEINKAANQTNWSTIDESQIKEEIVFTNIEKMMVEGKEISLNIEEEEQEKVDDEEESDEEAKTQLYREHLMLKKQVEVLTKQLDKAKKEAAKYKKRWEEATKLSTNKEGEKGKKRTRREQAKKLLENIENEMVEGEQQQEITQKRRKVTVSKLKGKSVETTVPEAATATVVTEAVAATVVTVAAAAKPVEEAETVAAATPIVEAAAAETTTKPTEEEAVAESTVLALYAATAEEAAATTTEEAATTTANEAAATTTTEVEETEAIAEDGASIAATRADEAVATATTTTEDEETSPTLENGASRAATTTNEEGEAAAEKQKQCSRKTEAPPVVGTEKEEEATAAENQKHCSQKTEASSIAKTEEVKGAAAATATADVKEKKAAATAAVKEKKTAALASEKEKKTAAAAEEKKKKAVAAAAEKKRKKEEALAAAAEKKRKKEEEAAATAAEKKRKKEEAVAAAAEQKRKKEEEGTTIEQSEKIDSIISSIDASISKGIVLAPTPLTCLAPKEAIKGSITRGVIERKRYTKKRDPQYTYPSEEKKLKQTKEKDEQKKGKAVEESAIDENADQKNEEIPCKNLEESLIADLMTDDEKNTINVFYKDAKHTKTAWGFPEVEGTVLASSFEEILYKDFIYGDVIDWYGNYLHRNLDQTGKCIILTNYVGHFILKNELDGIKNTLTRRLKNDLKEEVDYILLPFQNKEGNHWLLLALDMQSWEWSFYDSLSRKKKNGTYPSLEDAKKIKKCVYEEIVEVAKQKKITPDVERDIDVISCPQQDPQGNACALYVMKFMEEVLKQGGINLPNEAELPTAKEWKKMDRWRVEILLLILKDNDEVDKEYLLLGQKQESLGTYGDQTLDRETSNNVT